MFCFIFSHPNALHIPFQKELFGSATFNHEHIKPLEGVAEEHDIVHSTASVTWSNRGQSSNHRDMSNAENHPRKTQNGVGVPIPSKAKRTKKAKEGVTAEEGVTDSNKKRQRNRNKTNTTAVDGDAVAADTSSPIVPVRTKPAAVRRVLVPPGGLRAKTVLHSSQQPLSERQNSTQQQQQQQTQQQVSDEEDVGAVQRGDASPIDGGSSDDDYFVDNNSDCESDATADQPLTMVVGKYARHTSKWMDVKGLPHSTTNGSFLSFHLWV